MAVPVFRVARFRAKSSGVKPLLEALAMHLSARGVTPAFLWPGDGAPRQVDLRADTAADVGAAALLAAAFAPVWIGADAKATIAAAVAAGAQAILTARDDVRPKATFLVTDAVGGVRRRWPWQPAPRGDLLITVGPTSAQARFPDTGLPRVAARLTPLPTGMDWPGTRVFAFASVSVPERFYATLHDLGAEVVGRRILERDDHLTPVLLARLEQEAAAQGAQLVTTERDAVRLPQEFRAKVLVVPVRLDLAAWDAVDAVLDRCLAP